LEGLPISNQLSIPATVTQIIAGENITIDQPNGNVTINAPGGGGGGGVLTIAGLSGTVTLSSPDDSITITPDGQDIGLTLGGSVVTSVAAGNGIGVDAATGDVTISNSGVLSVSDGTTVSTGAVVLSGSSGVSVVNTSGTFAITNSGVTQLTGGDGIGLNVQTGSVTVSNLGLLSASPGAGIGVSTASGVATISNTGVRTLADLSGAVLLTGGTGVGVVTNTGTNTITLSNTGITSLTAGTAIGVTGSTITNNGVQSFYDLSGAITVSATGLTISKLGQNIDWTVNFPSPPVTSVNAQTGAVLIDAGDGIVVTNSETPSINIANSGVLTVVAGQGISLTDDTPQHPTINVVARTYTLLGATTGGVITYSKASGSGNTWATNTWILANTIQINVPPGWVAGESVGFDGYEYLNWDSNVASYFAIYYVTPSQPTEQSLIGTTTPGAFTDAIFGSNGGQAYLPMNLTIPPTYLVSGSTITLRIYGLLTSASHYLAADPTIDARVNIVYP
jgi:hypothetical protein